MAGCRIDGCAGRHCGLGLCSKHYQRFKNTGMTTLRRRPSVTERFWSKVDKSGGAEVCWPWTAGCLSSGYGGFMITKRPYVFTTAHRFAYVLTSGPVANGLYVCHRCDNPPCVNPAHMFLGTPAENMQDAKRKGRLRVGSCHPCSKLTEGQVSEMRRLREDGWLLRVLAERYGVREPAVSRICNRIRRAG